VVGLGGPAAAGSEEPDNEPLQVSLDAFVHPKIGSQVHTTYDGRGRFVYWHGTFFLQWSAQDTGSGICGQSVAWRGYETLGGDDDPVLGNNTVEEDVDKGDRRWIVRNLNRINHDRIPDRFVVRVRDCENNEATSTVAGVTFGTREDRSSKVTYAGQWRTVKSATMSGRTAHRTSSKNARFTTTFNGGRRPVALVMDKLPDGGKADVYVDGKLRKTVDTAGHRRHRIVVWQGVFPAGKHTLRVVNRPRAGHRQITFDTLILGSGPGS
jgi:hypothetical protein